VTTNLPYVLSIFLRALVLDYETKFTIDLPADAIRKI